MWNCTYYHKIALCLSYCTVMTLSGTQRDSSAVKLFGFGETNGRQLKNTFIESPTNRTTLFCTNQEFLNTLCLSKLSGRGKSFSYRCFWTSFPCFRDKCHRTAGPWAAPADSGLTKVLLFLYKRYILLVSLIVGSCHDLWTWKPLFFLSISKGILCLYSQMMLWKIRRKRAEFLSSSMALTVNWVITC